MDTYVCWITYGPSVQVNTCLKPQDLTSCSAAASEEKHCIFRIEGSGMTAWFVYGWRYEVPRQGM
jgi:hypothetical protein